MRARERSRPGGTPGERANGAPRSARRGGATRQHGQATVELALGGIVYVGVLLIGIHLAEYAQLSLKVQDAEAFAVWESTGKRVQKRFENGDTNTEPFDDTLSDTSGVGPMSARRFADFDGLSGTNGGNIISYALTEGSGVDVACQADTNLRFAPSRTPGPLGPVPRGLLRDVGGLRCSASASIKAINVPKAFLQKEDDGFFKEKLTRTQPIRVCGMGLPVNGACRGELSILTNDWGLVGEETKECKNQCQDSKYRAMVERLFGGGGGAGRAFAEMFAGTPDSDANEFHFSFSGVESSMRDYVGGEGDTNFITGGAGSGMIPRMTRPKCFLGKDCP